MRTTPLHPEHVAAGAKLVDFAGWHMPLHYGSQIEEHHAVRRDAGMFDTSHMLAVDVAGAGAGAFLRHMLANDVGRLAPGKALYSCMLAADGGILDDLIVYARGDGGFRVVVNAATADSDLAWLNAKLPGDVELRPRRDLAMLAVQGPNAAAKLAVALPHASAACASLRPFFSTEMGEAFIGRTGYTGEDGFELLLPAASAAPAWQRCIGAGIRPCGLGARDTLRLEAGLMLYGQDMDSSVTPLECGLGWTVALDGGRDFVGAEALRRRERRFQTLGLVLEGRGGVLRAHQEVKGAHGDGVVTSGTFSPTLGQSIALARLPTSVDPGQDVQVQVRDKLLEARVVKPPFVRHGQIRTGKTS